MPWTKGVLLFTVSVMTFSSLVMAGLEAFSKAAASGAVSGGTIHFGKLLIGGESVPSENKMETSGLSLAKQSDKYRTNEDERFRLAKVKLQRLSPSLHCGNDSMTLRVPGPRTPHFLVDRGEQSPVSLSEMPASCGFSLKRVRRDVSFVAPYNGCNVRQEGGSYVLPLIIMGAPVQMSCPVSPRLPVVTCSSSAMKVSLCVRADDVTVKVDGLWMPLLLLSSSCLFTLETVGDSLVITAPITGRCWEMKDNERQLPLKYGGQEVVLSCPSQPAATVSPTAPIPVRDPFGVPQMYQYFPYGDPWLYAYLKQFPIVQPATTTTAPPPQDPIPPQILNQLYPYYLYSKGSSQAAASPQQLQSWYSLIAPNYDFTKFQMTTPAPTTTTAAQFVQYPGYPVLYPYQYLKPQRSDYPYMPYLPKKSVFTPQSLDSVLPPWLDSVYRARWQKK